jgi:hypothetical protein
MFKITFWVVFWEVIGSLIIYWMGLIPGEWLWGFVGEVVSVFATVFKLSFAYGAAFFAGTKAHLDLLSNWKAVAIWIMIMVVVASFSLYCFGYMTFKSRVARAGITYLGFSPEASADKYLQVKTGRGGVVGFFLLTPRSEAEIDIEDETITIPRSGLATGINWLYRLATIGVTFFVAYKGAVLGMVEKAQSVKENRDVSYDKIIDFSANVIPD